MKAELIDKEGKPTAFFKSVKAKYDAAPDKEAFIKEWEDLGRALLVALEKLKKS